MDDVSQRPNGAWKRTWRVFYTYPRAEFKCEERVRSEGVETLLLKREVLRQWSDRKKRVVEPVFRNYLFAHVNEKERISVLETPGVLKCVSFGPRMAEVPETEIDQLRLAQKEPARLGLFDGHLPERGTKVTVTDGPLNGLTGEIMEHRGENYVVVRIHAIRQALKVNVPAEWIKVHPVSNAA